MNRNPNCENNGHGYNSDGVCIYCFKDDGSQRKTTDEKAANPQANTLDEQIRKAIKAYKIAGGDPEFYIISKSDHDRNWAQAVTEARIEGGQVSINTEIPKKITGFESMPAMSICRNLTIQDAKINEIIDYLSQLALKENK